MPPQQRKQPDSTQRPGPGKHTDTYASSQHTDRKDQTVQTPGQITVITLKIPNNNYLLFSLVRGWGRPFGRACVRACECVSVLATISSDAHHLLGFRLMAHAERRHTRPNIACACQLVDLLGSGGGPEHLNERCLCARTYKENFLRCPASRVQSVGYVRVRYVSVWPSRKPQFRFTLSLTLSPCLCLSRQLEFMHMKLFQLKRMCTICHLSDKRKYANDLD